MTRRIKIMIGTKIDVNELFDFRVNERDETVASVTIDEIRNIVFVVLIVSI